MKTRTAVILWTLALLLAVGGGVLIFTSDHDETPWQSALLALPVGLAFVAAGLVARSRRSENRTGVLLTAFGFTWFIGALAESDNSLLFTLGVAFGSLAFGFLLHVLLAFPSGRLGARATRLLAAATYVLVVAGPPAAMLVDADPATCAECPENAFLVWDDQTAAEVLEAIVTGVAFALLIATIGVLVSRWRAATPTLRRALTPVYLTGCLVFCLLALYVVVEAVSGPSELVDWLTLASLLLVPLAFLYGLLRTRLARAGVGRLLVETPEEASSDQIQDALRRALGDPTLNLALWLPERGGYVDAEGKPYDLPAATATCVTTPIEYEDRPVAALVHDAALLQEPELLEEVSAAVRLGLEKDRGMRALRASEARHRALVDAIPDLMFRLSSDGTYLDFKADSDRDLVSADVIGRSVYDRLPRDVADLIMVAARRALAGGTVETIEYELAFDGEPRQYEGRIVASGEDEFVYIVREITDRKRAEAELQASRARIVEASDSERRRLERNLHDGAQQRLVAVSLALRLAHSRLEEEEGGAGELISGATAELSLALEDLRELARGIHPAVLTERGLAAALEALAARSPIRVALLTTEERLPPSVEAAAYYVVSEALTNVAKYARASTVDVRIGRSGGEVLVEVRDDGVGGADPSAGSGLRGLADRLAALQGRLEVTSAPGAGTCIRAQIPCTAGEPAAA